MKAKLSLLLHFHIPYVRKRGVWPYGEEWVHEAILDCYLPLLVALCEVEKKGIKNTLVCSVTPILAEQLCDSHIKEKFLQYINHRIELTSLDERDFQMRGWHELKNLACAYLESLMILKSYWLSIDGNIIGELVKLASKHVIEIGTSSATHGILPLLDTKSIDRQLEIGLESATRLFGFKPFSFWMPECAYKPGLEKQLQNHGIGCVFMDSVAVTGRFETPGFSNNFSETVTIEPKQEKTLGTTYKPYLLGSSRVNFMARNFYLSKQVWSAKEGYPGDSRYREFHKRYERSGNRYWKVTSLDTNLGNKEIYDIHSAQSIANDHARHFIHKIWETANSQIDGDLVFLSFDAELFGHWWHEGIDWLRNVILEAGESENVELVTPKDYLVKNPPKSSVRPPVCTWGNKSDLSTWLDPETDNMWNDLAEMADKFNYEVGNFKNTQLHTQLLRELLLAQSSDWEFLVTTKQAKSYGLERFKTHKDAFYQLLEMSKSGIDIEKLGTLQDTDNPFKFLEAV
jgi:1,4-alpha-glucan branching enzyme